MATTTTQQANAVEEEEGGNSNGHTSPTPSTTPRTLATHSSGGESGSDGMPKLFKIVLTGGPCGGKTTALARLSEFFRTHGMCVCVACWVDVMLPVGWM